MNLPPYGNTFYQANAMEAVLKAKPQPTPDMTLQVSAGGAWLNGKTYVEFAGGNSGTFTAPDSDARWSLLSLTNIGSLEITNGTASASPVFPSFPRNQVVIAAVYVQSTTTTLTTENVFDFRPFISSSVYSHIDLDNKDETSAHPISSITNLQTELNSRPTSTTVNTSLSGKADTTGTTSTTFTLNSDESGTPSSNVSLAVERGTSTNVSFRWNETDDQWEYTDDGTNYYAIKNSEFTASNADDWDTTEPETIWAALDELAARVAVLESA